MMSSTAIEQELENMLKNNITITIGSTEAKEALIKIIKRVNKKPKIHIKIDTGFGRYGYLYTDTERIIKDIKELQKFAIIEGIFSHFSTSFYKEKWTNLQYERFLEVLKTIEEHKINIPIKHISNSSAFIRFPQMSLSAVRIGSAFLGRVAVANKLGLKKIGYLESEISEIKTLPKGWNIGYSNTYTTKKETKVAIVPTGYAEGYHMKLSSDMLSFGNKVRDVIQAIKSLFKNTKLYVEINNKRYPILGRIGMYHVTVDITGEDFKIGYRGETLYAFQNILTAVAGKNIENRVRVILDIEGYKEKREKTLEDLAEKVAKTVIKTRKSVTLEPMQPYERKIIHSKLQDNDKVETKSIGEEPRRRIVISLKK